MWSRTVLDAASPLDPAVKVVRSEEQEVEVKVEEDIPVRSSPDKPMAS